MLSNSGVQSISGQAAAAEANRQSRARDGILDALGRLGIPYGEWPDFVQAHYRSSSQRTTFRQLRYPRPFQPPLFDRLNESAKEWTKKANLEWDRHRNQFLEGCAFGVAQGVDEEIAATKRSRGPGKAQQRRKRENTAIERRYEWAGRRLCGAPWKEIAAEYRTKESTVIKAASDVLRIAAWPTKPKPRTLSTPTPHQDFPKWKYHRSKPACLVNDAKQESALGPGWTDAPQG